MILNLKTLERDLHELLSENFFLDNTIGDIAYIIIKNIIMFLIMKIVNLNGKINMSYIALFRNWRTIFT